MNSIERAFLVLKLLVKDELEVFEILLAMKYSPEHIQKFKSLYRKHFGMDLSDKEATDKIRSLLVCVEIGLQPQPP